MKRIACLDYAKALAILFVVLIHTGFYQLDHIVLFAMPVFFAATGYSFDPKKRTFSDAVKLRFKAVMLPFWGFMACYAVLELVRAPLFGYGSWTIVFPSLANMIYGSGILPLNGAAAEGLREIMSYKLQPAVGVDVILPSNCHLWFLPAMFTGYVLFAALAQQTEAGPLRKIGALAVLLLLASVELVFPAVCQLPFGLGRGAIGAAFMLVGYWLKRSGALERRSSAFHIAVCLGAAVLYGGALRLGSTGSAMVRSFYGPHGGWSVLLTFIGGTAGIWLALELCRGIDRLPFHRIKDFLSFTGQNVMTVYALHMAVKFLFDALYIFCLHDGNRSLLDAYQMSLLPEISGFYMVFEAVCILALCLLAAKRKQKV